MEEGVRGGGESRGRMAARRVGRSGRIQRGRGGDRARFTRNATRRAGSRSEWPAALTHDSAGAAQVEGRRQQEVGRGEECMVEE